jgi:periplasmic nitrate reductase NapD
MSALLHIASFVIHHRLDAGAALDAALAELPDTDLALRSEGRSIVLCEGDSEGAVTNRIESLRDVDGVLGVSLVYHHAEPRDHLLEEMSDADPS